MCCHEILGFPDKSENPALVARRGFVGLKVVIYKKLTTQKQFDFVFTLLVSSWRYCKFQH